MDPSLSTALDACEAAAAVQRRHAGRLDPSRAREKGTSDWVSEADVEAQRAVLEVVHARFPTDAVLAEEDEEGRQATEGGPSRAGHVRTWVVDPIDGTTNFLHGHPMYAVSVALWEDAEPRAGAVLCPATGERWWASRDGGAWKDGRRLRVSGGLDARRALVGTGFPFKKLERLDAYLAQLGRVLRATSGVRRGGAAALDLAYLAEGRLDAFWETELQPWDFAAGALLVEEAGGVIERLEGGGLELEASGVIAANGAAQLAALRDMIEGRAPGG